MAETDVNDAAQRYAVIEQAYSKEDWAMVLRDGGELLQQIQQTGNPQFLGLRMRLQLLLGHTHLYGFADKTAAAEFYTAVASHSREASLAKIAQQGLKQCSVSAPPSAEPEPDTQTRPSPDPEPARDKAAAARATATPATATTTSPLTTGPKAASPFSDPAPATPDIPGGAESASPAAPWLTAMTPGSTPTPEATTAPTPAPFMVEAGAKPAVETPPALGEVKGGEPAAPWSEESLIPEVVEEPELIELHQADPAVAEELELTLKEPDPAQPGPATLNEKEDEDLLSGLLLVRVG